MGPNAEPLEAHLLGMNSGLISIIMPVFNGEKYIRQAISSVLEQDYQNWELLVVDDGSTDSTAEIIAEYVDPRIHYYYQKNRGQTASLNQGLRLGQGEFITTLDADDWLPVNSLAARCYILNQYPDLGVVYGDGVYCDESGKSLLRFTEQMPAGVTGDVYETLIVSPFYGTGASVMVRRSVIDTHEIQYDEQIVWCQDWDIYIRLAEKARFGFTPENTINYRIHSKGMTVTMPTGRRLESLVRLRYKVMDSSRFSLVSVEQKAAFFYDFLVKDLNNRIADQTKIFTGSQFMELPTKQQARLLRLAAINYLLDNKHIEISKKWLRSAWQSAPQDIKSLVAYLSWEINPKIAVKLLGRWQHAHNQTAEKSPFEVVIK